MKIPVYKPFLTEKERSYLIDCYDSSWISSKGHYIDKFELAISNYVGSKHAIAVSNGTVALHLALLAYDIGPGDEVIVPDFTYIATANSVKYIGAHAILADVELDTWNLSLSTIEACVTKNTKALIVADIYGTPLDLDPIKNYCKENNIILVEDAAESIGAKYHGLYAGNLAEIGTLSFFGNKTITTGEGGMIITNNTKIANYIRKLMNQGNSDHKRYFHDVLGYNYRLTNMQAAIGLGQIERIESILENKKRVFDFYYERLSTYVGFQKVPSFVDSSNWMVGILLKSKTIRDRIARVLDEKGVETRPFFYPIHSMPFYKSKNNPNSKLLSSRGLCLPSYPQLCESELEYITDIVLKELQLDN